VALVSICNVFYIILTSICLLGRRVWKPNFFSSKFRIVFVARKECFSFRCYIQSKRYPTCKYYASYYGPYYRSIP
jgi:hypothetical protein